MSKLLIICGISFAGKSTLAEAIAHRFDYAQVDVDDMKVHLYGPESKDEDLSHVDWVRIYHETDKLIESYLQSGKTVIDASRNFRKDERQLAKSIVTQLRAEAVTIFVDTPEGIARKRLLENRKKQARRDVTDQDFEKILGNKVAFYQQMSIPPCPISSSRVQSIHCTAWGATRRVQGRRYR